jgi:Heterokaryon incompatibility protein (HET)
MCQFIKQLSDLDSSQPESQHSDVSVSSGTTTLILSNLDTYEPWWHLLGLNTTRTVPEFAWFRKEGSSSALKSQQPRILITCSPPNQDEATSLLSAPRHRSEIEQSHGIIDLEIIKDWLRICDAKHGSSCKIVFSGSEKPNKLRLIDVSTRKIIDSDCETPRYVALSYVWGTSSKTSHGRLPSNAATSTLSGLAEASIFRVIPQKLPATFEDAITVCQRLAEHYLWIDLFCIDQSKHGEIQDQINQMNKIYQAATLTIVARDSTSAYDGLAGVSVPLKNCSQPICQTQEGTLMGTYLRPAIADSGKSAWQTRAWTLQESLFSHRLLVFSKNTSLICRQEYFHETLVNTLKHRGPSSLTNRLDWLDDDYSIDLNLPHWAFRNYNALISIYTNRILRYTDDILNACRGALSELQLQTGIKFSYGIPVADPHRALLWTPHFSHTLSRRGDCWPSWSWCGWMGRVEWKYWITDLAEYEGEADLSDTYVSILNRPSKKRQRLDRDKSPTSTRSEQNLEPAIVNFPESESFHHLPILRITSHIAKCTLVKAPSEAREPTTLTYADDETGTATKKDLGYHWTLLPPDSLSSQSQPKTLVDIANCAGEPEIFDESDHFLRLSEEESDRLEEYATRARGQLHTREQEKSQTKSPGKGKGKAKSKDKTSQRKSVIRVPAQLVFIKHWDLIRDSEEHDAWLADMVGCLVVLPVDYSKKDSLKDLGTSNDEDGDRNLFSRIGMVVVERETFEGFKPMSGQVSIV